MNRSGEQGSATAVAVVALVGVLVFAAFVGGLAAALGGQGGCESAQEGGGSIKGEVPAKLIPIYEGAAGRYGLGPKGPAMLASINFNETSFGTNMNNETGSGAEGWMMFMPETWASWGVDGNGDGKKDPYNPWDAIFAAARYLRASGAPGDWYKAIFAYTHADWYVQRILGDFRRFYGGPIEAAAGQPASASAELCGPSAGASERIAKMVAEANRLSLLRPETEYVWGGSHGVSPTPPNGPFDCSSAVSHLLQVGGFEIETMDTVGLYEWAQRGPGRWVTIFDNPFGREAHTFIRFNPSVTPASKRYWGTSGSVMPGHGPGWIPESTFSAEYLSGFHQLHPPGL
jgi:hypothetical protein